eukprot:350796-Chlamydomonas_euryale.AAC.1
MCPSWWGAFLVGACMRHAHNKRALPPANVRGARNSPSKTMPLAARGAGVRASMSSGRARLDRRSCSQGGRWECPCPTRATGAAGWTCTQRLSFAVRSPRQRALNRRRCPHDARAWQPGVGINRAGLAGLRGAGVGGDAAKCQAGRTRGEEGGGEAGSFVINDGCLKRACACACAWLGADATDAVVPRTAPSQGAAEGGGAAAAAKGAAAAADGVCGGGVERAGFRRRRVAPLIRPAGRPVRRREPKVWGTAALPLPLLQQLPHAVRPPALHLGSLPPSAAAAAAAKLGAARVPPPSVSRRRAK